MLIKITNPSHRHGSEFQNEWKQLLIRVVDKFLKSSRSRKRSGTRDFYFGLKPFERLWSSIPAAF